MEGENFIKQSYIIEKNEMVPPEIKNKLDNLIKRNICLIIKKGTNGTGFFCKIAVDASNYLKMLITNNHVLNEKEIEPGKTIELSINNNDIKKKIVIDKNRGTYTDKFYDVTIIQIKENDGIDKNSFFDLDEQIFQKNAKEIFLKCSIFAMHYPNGGYFTCSKGTIEKITEYKDRLTVYHTCNTEHGSSGCPLVNKKNLKVIGIHKGTSKEEDENINIGILLKGPIEKCKEIMKKYIPTQNLKEVNFNFIFFILVYKSLLLFLVIYY